MSPGTPTPGDKDGSWIPSGGRPRKDAAQSPLNAYYRDRGRDVEDVRFGGPYNAIGRKNGGADGSGDI